MLHLGSTEIALNINAIEQKLTDISSMLTPTYTHTTSFLLAHSQQESKLLKGRLTPSKHSQAEPNDASLLPRTISTL